MHSTKSNIVLANVLFNAVILAYNEMCSAARQFMGLCARSAGRCVGAPYRHVRHRGFPRIARGTLPALFRFSMSNTAASISMEGDPKDRPFACFRSKESMMKSRLVSAALAAALLTAAGAASAQQMYYRTANVPGQATPDTYTQAQMDQGTTMPSPSGDSSYGGAPMSRSAAGMGGSTISKPCTRGTQCDIFFGN
jgi:hypothetical protein